MSSHYSSANSGPPSSLVIEQPGRSDHRHRQTANSTSSRLSRQMLDKEDTRAGAPDPRSPLGSRTPIRRHPESIATAPRHIHDAVFFSSGSRNGVVNQFGQNSAEVERSSRSRRSSPDNEDGGVALPSSMRSTSRFHRRDTLAATPASYLGLRPISTNSHDSPESWALIESDEGRRSRNGWRYGPKKHSTRQNGDFRAPVTSPKGHRQSIDSTLGAALDPPPSYRTSSHRRSTRSEAPTFTTLPPSAYGMPTLSSQNSRDSRNMADPYPARTAPRVYLGGGSESRSSCPRDFQGVENSIDTHLRRTGVTYGPRGPSRTSSDRMDVFREFEFEQELVRRGGRAPPTSTGREWRDRGVDYVDVRMPKGTEVTVVEGSSSGRRRRGDSSSGSLRYR